ncbi:MAG TPA: TauD/TfdA family dioxygenase [Burkholderiales bacterium]|nr:TauD/TfdA family dioxygenase [Burkholderiales bacterium]
MALHVEPLSEVCGAEVHGIDVTKPLASEDVANIAAAFDRHKVLVFRRQPMTARELAAFSAHFGELQVHVQVAYQHPEVPEVVQMTNRKADGTFDEVGASRGAAPNTRDGWHSDLSFERAPAKATLLHAIEIPDRGGNTCFSNTTLAYLALPEDLKRRLDGLSAEFVYGQAKRNALAAKAAEALRGAAKSETAAVHPVIVRHAATGEPGIYVNPYTTQRILGIPEDESEAIIERLADEMESMAYRWEHVWSVGDTLMWDNRGTLMHSGRIDYPLNQARRFIRTTVRGTPLTPYRLRADSIAA